MKNEKGFSMIGLMAVVAIVSIIAVVSLPVYNQYIERTKVSKEIPVIGTYKNDIASCFMKKDSLKYCNDGESGIHPGLDDNGKILSLKVLKGNIVMIIDAQNHIEDVEPIELMYVVNPQLDATFPTLDWNLYCNDYSSDNNALVKECKGLIIDKDGDGYNDSVEEEWGSNPLDPDSVPENWQPIESLFTDWSNNGGRVYDGDWSPEINNQTSDFTQTRSYTQEQTRERTDREQDSFSGDVRVVDVITETKILSGEESRDVAVNNTSGGWVDTGSAYACSDWNPSASDYYETQMIDQTRVCSQDQESTYIYSVGGSFTDTQTVNITEERTIEGTQPLWVPISDDISDWVDVGSRTDTSAWSPNITGQISDFTQARSYKQKQEKTTSEREENQLTGEIRVINSITEEQTVTREESRNVTVTETEWQNVGDVFNCGAWGPEADTIEEGQVFTQNRDCLQEQEKTYTYTANADNIGSMTINRDTEVTEEREETGTKIVWTSIPSTTSGWVDVGSKVYTSGWLPEVSNQNSGFEQERSYDQDQKFTEYVREENQITGEIRVVDEIVTERTIEGFEQRYVTVTEGNWTNAGGAFSCGSWSPSLSGYTTNERVRQTSTCLQRIEKIYEYTSTGLYETRTESDTTTTTSVRYRYGTQSIYNDDKTSGSSETVIDGDLICGNSHPYYNYGSISNYEKNKIIEAYKNHPNGYGRCPETSGYRYWVNRMISGLSISGMQNEIRNSTDEVSGVVKSACERAANSTYGYNRYKSADFIKGTGNRCIVRF